MTLTKADVIYEIQTQTGLTKNEGSDLFKALIEVMLSTLEKGEDLLISNFGKFCVKDKAPRKGRNPATGKKITLPARRVVTFKCSQKLREAVDKK